MTALFEPSRSNGQSDRQIVFALVSGAEPGTTFTHEQLRDALQKGIDKPISMQRIYKAAGKANHDLGREEQRALGAVPGIGYRVLAANEHHGAALVRKGMAEKNMRRGIELLRDVREDELDPAALQLYRGTAMVWSGVMQAMRASTRRHDKQEDLIEDLRGRVARLEGEDDDPNPIDAVVV